MSKASTRRPFFNENDPPLASTSSGKPRRTRSRVNKAASASNLFSLAAGEQHTPSRPSGPSTRRHARDNTMRSPSERSDVTIRAVVQSNKHRQTQTFSLGWPEIDSPVTNRKWSGGFVRDDLTNSARKHVIRPKPRQQQQQQHQEAAISTPANTRIFSNTSKQLHDDQDDPTNPIGYTSLAQLLERHGYAETRIISPVSQQRQEPVVVPVESPCPPSRSLKPKKSFSLRLWSLISTGASSRVEKKMTATEKGKTKAVETDQCTAVASLAAMEESDPETIKHFRDESTASDSTVKFRAARARAWVDQTAEDGPASLARPTPRTIQAMLPETPRSVSSPAQLVKNGADSTALGALQDLSARKIRRPSPKTMPKPTSVEPTNEPRHSYESFAERPPFPDDDDDDDDEEVIAYDDVKESPKMKRTMEISVLRPQASWSQSLFSLSFVSAFSKGQQPVSQQTLRQQKSQPALIRKAASSSALRPVVTTEIVESHLFFK